MLVDRRSSLREATEGVHRKLDGIIDDAGYFLDRRSYAEYLTATLQARQPLEAALNECKAERLFNMWPDRIISPALTMDIGDVAETALVAEKDSIVLSKVFSVAQAVGTLYVLEGSALGARHLAPRAHAIGMNETFGARHFARQLATPKSWSAFLQVLEAASFDSSQEDECVDASLMAFGLFERAYTTHYLKREFAVSESADDK